MRTPHLVHQLKLQKFGWLLTIGMLLHPPSMVLAVDLVSQTSLPLSLAQQAATAALDKCQEGNYWVSVAVVDQSGNLQVLLRMNNAGPHTIDSSSHKAYTAASLRRSTNHLAELVSQKPSLAALRDMNEKILILGGGLPIKVNGKIVGGIGVGGAPGAHLDEACAQAGLTAINADK
ncbi:MAG: heme-binding protein [Nitrospirae bacterium]|nr:heme-binding protein [Nitrospirota bacterium]